MGGGFFSEELKEGQEFAADIPGILLRTTIFTWMRRRYFSLTDFKDFNELRIADSPDDSGGEIFRREEPVFELHGGSGPEAVSVFTARLSSWWPGGESRKRGGQRAGAVPCK